MNSAHLAIDLGASSGRAILGVLEGSPAVMNLEEVHRFEHVGLPTPTGPVWNLTDIWRNILEGLDKAIDYCLQNDIELSSIGVDCWGVDYALLGTNGELLALPHCYRDPRNDFEVESTLELLGGFESLYDSTGIQLMGINTLFQLRAQQRAEPHLFDAAMQLLFVPDLFHYWLSGEIAVERTIASTSSLLNVHSGDWDFDLIRKIDLPTHLFGKIVEPGTVLGELRPELAERLGSQAAIKVVCPASHDTASAVAAIPVHESETSGWAYLSSGTWSLLGAELDEPNVSTAARQMPFTNERGVDGKIRFLKNITGLWMVQELRRELNAKPENDYDFSQLMEAARLAEPFRTLVDPAHEPFLKPGNMAEKIRSFAQCHHQPEPETAGDLVRCCLESLAICYANTLERLESVLGMTFDRIHIVGGGSKNELLNRLTCDAVGRTVIAGPEEATAIGNLLVQAIGMGAIDGLDAAREIVGRSFKPRVLEPEGNSDEWATAKQRLLNHE